MSGHGDHSDIWDYLQGHSHELAELREELGKAQARIKALESQTPSAQQAQYEADVAMADLEASGFSLYLSDECDRRYHDRCPPGMVCECECHLDGKDKS